MYCAMIEEGDGWWRRVTELEDVLASTGRTIIYYTWDEYNSVDLADELENASGMLLPRDMTVNGYRATRDGCVKRLDRVRLYDEAVFTSTGTEFYAHCKTHGSARLLHGGHHNYCRHVFCTVDGKRQWLTYLDRDDDIVILDNKLDDGMLIIPDAGIVFEYRPGLLGPILEKKAKQRQERAKKYRKKRPPRVTINETTTVVCKLLWSMYDNIQAYSVEWNHRSLWVMIMAHDAAKGRQATNKILRPYAKLWANCPATAWARLHLPDHILRKTEDRLRAMMPAGTFPNSD